MRPLVFCLLLDLLIHLLDCDDSSVVSHRELEFCNFKFSLLKSVEFFQPDVEPHFETHRGMIVKIGMISGPFRATLFNVITWNPESNCTCREESSPIPMKFFDVTRATNTPLDVMQEQM